MLAFNLLSFLLFGLTFTSFFAGGALDFLMLALLLNPFVNRLPGPEDATGEPAAGSGGRGGEARGESGSSGAQFILS